jgi:MFS family permease
MSTRRPGRKPPAPSPPWTLNSPPSVPDPARAHPAERRLQRLLLLSLLVGTVNGLSRVALPLFAAALGGQAWQVGIVGGLGYTGIVLLALPMGAWMDQHGGRRLFLWGIALAVPLYLLLSLAVQPWQAVLMALMLGLALPLRTVPSYTEFLALLPSLSPARAGWNRAANMTGMFFLGPAISAAAITALGFPPVFVLAALGLACAGLLGRRALGHGERAQQHERASLLSRMADQIKLVREHTGLRRTLAIDFLAQVAVAYYVVFGMIIAVRELGMPLQSAASLVTLQGAVYVGTLLVGAGPLAALRTRHAYLLALGLLLLECLLFGLGTQPWMLWIGSALLGLGSGIQALLSTNSFAQWMRSFGRGRIGGLASLAAPSGGVLGAIGGGLLSQQLGPHAGFLGLAAAFALSVVWLVRRQPDT